MEKPKILPPEVGAGELAFPKDESIEEYIKRGGVVNKCKPGNANCSYDHNPGAYYIDSHYQIKGTI